MEVFKFVQYIIIKKYVLGFCPKHNFSETVCLPGFSSAIGGLKFAYFKRSFLNRKFIIFANGGIR